MPIRKTLLLLATSLAAPIACLAQTSAVPAWQTKAGGKTSFDVASVRLSAPGQAIRPSVIVSAQENFIPSGGLFIADETLLQYIDFAYKLFLTPEQTEALLAPLPRWVSTQHFAIRARATGDPTKDHTV